MRAVGQRATSAERTVQVILRHLGVRYRLNHPGLPGRPDFVNRSRGWAIFVHGCFWTSGTGTGTAERRKAA